MQRFSLIASLLTVVSVGVFAASHSAIGRSVSDNLAETQIGQVKAEVKSNHSVDDELKSLALTNSDTGETFTLADFEGKTVVVKSMATWCGKCKSNLKSIQAAQTQLNDPDLVVVALSVEANLPDEDLAQYAEDEGFDFVFAVATPDMTRALASEFGQTALNPSIGSHFIIDANGHVSDLTTGTIDSQELVTRLQAANQQADAS